MNRLFSLLLFAAFLYQLMRGGHAVHQALTPEPVKSGSHGKTRQEFGD